MQDEKQLPPEEKPSAVRIRVRMGEMRVPTLQGEDVCPKCKARIRMPMPLHTDKGMVLAALVPDIMLRRGGEIRGTCTCGQEVVLYTSRVLSALGRMR